MKKRIVFVFILFLSVFIVHSKVSANEMYLNIEHSAKAFVIQDNTLVDVNVAGEIAYHSTLQLQYEVRNTTGIVDTKVSLQGVEGIEYPAYYPGVLTINQIYASESQYHEFISNEGVSITLTTQATQINVNVLSCGSLRNRLVSELSIDAHSVQNGMKHLIYNHFFYGQFATPTFHTIQFINQDNQVLSEQRILDTQTASIPEIHLEGFTLLGFNTKKDGTGTYYHGETITSDQQYFAIFMKKEYVVRFFVKDSLYQTIHVAHGDTAQIDTPKLDKNTIFSGWDTPLTNITRDSDIHAILQDGEVKYTFEVINQSSSNEINKQSNFKQVSGGSNQDIVVDRQQVTTSKQNDTNVFPYIFIFFSFISMFFIWKKKK